MFLSLFKKKKLNLECDYSEKFILCNCIENYIHIAETNNNVIDDSISVIAFIKQLQKQYPEFEKDFEKYIIDFNKKGLLEKYNMSTNNVIKKMFLKYGTNPKKAREYIYGFVDGCSNRFMSYMAIIGLCGNPTTPLARYVLSIAYNYNSSIFCKQAIYYTVLYLNNGLCESEYKNDLRGKIIAKKTHLINLYHHLGISYERNKEYNKAIVFLKKSNSIRDINRVKKKIEKNKGDKS